MSASEPTAGPAGPDTGPVSRIGAFAALRRAGRDAPSLTRGWRRTLVLALIGTAGTIVVPTVVQRLLDDVLLVDGPIDVARAVELGSIAAVAVVVAGFASWQAMFRLVRAAASGLAELRTRVFEHVHRLSMLEVEAERRGALVARVTSDVEAITQFVEWGGIGMLIGGAQVVLVLGAMLVIEPLLAAAVVVAGLVYAVVLRFVQRVLARAWDRVRARVAVSLAAVGEAISGLPAIRAYGAEERTQERVDRALGEQFRAEFRVGALGAGLFSSAEVFAAAVTAGVVVLGVLSAGTTGITAGGLVAFLFLVTLFIEPVQLLVEIIDQAQSAAAGLRRVLSVLERPITIAEPIGGVDLPPGPLEVTLEHVRFAYPGGPDVLIDVDATIAAGQRVAVVGRTGSGKSTFVRLVARLLDPGGGEVRVGGVALTRVRSASLRARIAYVPQDVFLFDTTVGDNVRYGAPGASDAEVRGALAELGLTDWLGTLEAGLATRVGERGQRLSAGERQLVAIARAWIVGPDLLVLDEATSAVDPALEVDLRRAIEVLTGGRTSITVAHRLSTAESADRVLVFEAGRLVEDGPHARLLEQLDGVYARLHADWAANTAGGGPTAGAP
ncbi:MAG: hypothetical protein RLZZ272_394 [Actinomycetota bacterium]|jgi:putative ABC transport system ATP-binding protein